MEVTRINEENPKENIAGMVVQFGDFMFYQYMILAMGRRLYKQEGNKYIPTVSSDPNTVRALATIANLVKNKALIFNESFYNRDALAKEISALTKLTKHPYDIWGQGKAVIAPTNNAERGSGNAVFNSSAVNYPRGKDEDVIGLVEFRGLSIHRDSENKELCWELMEYISSDYFQGKVLGRDIKTEDYSFNGYVPTSAYSLGLDKELSEYQKNMIHDLMKTADNTTTPDEYEYKILAELMKAMQKVYNGEEDLEVILNQIDEYARENIF